MKVLLSGYYGFGNVGDESVLQAIIQGLQDQNPDIKITVLSAAPKITKELNGIKAIHRNNWLKIITRMLKTNVFISGGGTLFQNVTSTRSLYYYLSLILLAKIFFKKAVVLAQGFGPLNGKINRWITRFILDRANLITLRDQDSYDEIKKLGVKRPKIELVADPSHILKIPAINEGKKVLSLEAIRMDKPLVGIAVRSVPKQDEGQFDETLSSAIDWLCQTYDYSPVFVLFQCPEDMAQSSKVINTMSGKTNVIFRICRPDEMMAVIANFDLLIGMRLHSLIFAAMNEVPMLGLSYDPKVAAFMKEIDQPCLKVEHDLDLRELKNKLEQIVANKAEIKKNLLAKKKALRQKALQNFELFGNL